MEHQRNINISHKIQPVNTTTPCCFERAVYYLSLHPALTGATSPYHPSVGETSCPASLVHLRSVAFVESPILRYGDGHHDLLTSMLAHLNPEKDTMHLWSASEHVITFANYQKTGL